MKRKSIVLALILAAAATVTGPVWAQSSSALQTDRRIAINVSQAEKNQVLSEMREFLHGFHSINIAMARQDMKALAARWRKPMFYGINRIEFDASESTSQRATMARNGLAVCAASGVAGIDPAAVSPLARMFGCTVSSLPSGKFSACTISSVSVMCR